MRRHVSRLMVVMLGLFALAGCAPTAPPLPASANNSAVEPYTLAPGDKLRMIVFGETQLTQEYGVTNEGNISVPLIGDVAVAGKSVPQVEQEITSRLVNGGFLKDPRVSLEVIGYRQYYILGEVARPGAYPYSAGLNISQAIAAAGGYSYRANTRRVFIKRVDDAVEHSVDLRTRNVPIRAGDVIRVGERYF